MKPFEITGVLVSVGEKVQKTSSLSIREFVLEVGDDKYSNPVIFQLLNNKTELIAPYQEGETLRIAFFIRGWSKGVNLNCIEIGCELDHKPKPADLELPDESSIDFDSEEIPMGRNRTDQSDVDNRLEPDETGDLPF